MKPLSALLLGILLILNVPLGATGMVLFIVGQFAMSSAPSGYVPWQAYAGLSIMALCSLLADWLSKRYKAVSAPVDAETEDHHAAV